MNISGSVALVTGANRGLGRAFARELVRRGAAKVYGAARNPAAVTEPGVLPVALDITDDEQVARAAGQCADVSLLVNNAGVLRYSTFTSAGRRAIPGRQGQAVLRPRAHLPAHSGILGRGGRRLRLIPRGGASISR